MAGHQHEDVLHPEHRQGDLPLADGSRLFTCTKRLRVDARTSVLFVRGLFRLDVIARGDSLELKLRNLSGRPLSGGPAQARTRRVESFEGEPQILSEFDLDPDTGLAGKARVSVAYAVDPVDGRVPCTAVAIVTRRPA